MAKDREPPTLGDYVVVALSPALIMGLVGSLAFFLLEILYAGQWPERLRWTLFFFVFGAVLVARIAIQVDASRAWLYGTALGGVTFFAAGRFTDAGAIINVIVIAVVLWSANKLTWDCTYVDESAEDAGSGLLDEIREEIRSPASRGRQPPEDSESPNPPGADVPGSPKRARPMGRWVVYFSLAALPLFGLGQALIPAEDAGRRRYSFFLMTVYIACGLGLLLTTTLLGLRRYLRQRRLQMPAAMTGLWLGLGAVIIAGFLFVAALLPLSHPEFSLVTIRPIGSVERGASKYASQGGTAGKGEGRGGGKDKDPNAVDGSGTGQQGGRNSGQSGKPEGPGGEKSGPQGKGAGQSKTGNEPNGNRQRGESRSDQSDNSYSPPSTGFAALGNVLKWIVLAVLGVSLALAVLWFVARQRAGVSGWARKLLDGLSAFWRSLFGGSAPEEEIEEAVVVQERPRPFAEFRNPFADGTASGRSSGDLVRYSFAALEAWAFEQEMSRRPDETPIEFAERVGTAVPDLAEPGRRLTGLYAGLAYGRRRLPESSRTHVEAFWRKLEGSLTFRETHGAPP